jgi:hypothetical protein
LSQVEFGRSAALHVRRAKKGKPAVHPRYTALSPTRFKNFWRD